MTVTYKEQKRANMQKEKLISTIKQQCVTKTAVLFQLTFPQTEKTPKNVDPYGQFHKIESDRHPTFGRFVQSYTRHFQSFKTLSNLFQTTFPFTKWLRNYSPKEQLFGDLYSGLLLACSNIPLGIACSNLAGVPGVNGLYTILLASFFYPVFSAWPHGTLGPYAPIDISTGVHTHIILQNYYDSLPNGTSTEEVSAIVNPSSVTSTLVFSNGIICLIFGMLRLDFITEYFSEPLVGGFTSGIALYVVVSQLRPILGIPKPSMKKLGYEFPNPILMAQKLDQINLVSLGISVAAIVFLLVCKCFVQPFLDLSFPKRKVSVPWEFILLVLGIVVSEIFHLPSKHDVYVIGDMPNELPTPSLPLFWLMPTIFWRSLSISVVQLCIHMFGVRILTRRMLYKVDKVQETYALGSTLLLSGFFPVYSANNGLGASTLLQQNGATTQIASIFSGIIILVVTLTSASLFSTLPTSVMAVIVLIVVGRQLEGVFQIVHLWKTSKWDLTIWMSSFFASVVYGITYGLGIGMVFQLFTVVARTQWPKWTVWYSHKAQNNVDVCIFEFESMLLFTNCERFADAVRKTVSKWQDAKEKSSRLFILDCTAMIEVDTVGFLYLVDVLRGLEQKASVYYVRPKYFLIKTLRHEGIQIADYQVCETPSDAINRAEFRFLHSSSMDLLDEKETIGVVQF
ncbi:hypothetical protein M3Y97_01074600 [Aphelenchoides bicaudatus]|nr:hypothetical protein M3Y97_01074600 [Aphelenchoides bicaudatus]